MIRIEKRKDLDDASLYTYMLSYLRQHVWRSDT